MHVVRCHHHNQMKLILFLSDIGLLGLFALWKNLHFSVSSDKCVMGVLVNFIYQFDWNKGGTNFGKTLLLNVSVKVFPEEISI